MSYTIAPVQIAPTFLSSQTITALGVAPDTVTANTVGTNATRGDAAHIQSSTGNDGVYIVLDVISANVIEVYPALPSGVVDGTVRLRGQNHRLDIDDEDPVTAAIIETAMPDSRLFGLRHQIGAHLAAGQTFAMYGHLFRQIYFTHTLDIHCQVTIQREVWFLDWDGTIRGGGTTITEVRIRNIASQPGSTELLIGAQTDSGDPRSVDLGSILLNHRISGNTSPVNNNMNVRLLGSFIFTSVNDQGSNILSSNSRDGQCSGSIIDGRLFFPGIEQVNDVINYTPGQGIAVSSTGVANMARVLQANHGEGGAYFFASVEIVLEGSAWSDACTNPLIANITSPITLKNPQEDYAPVIWANDLDESASQKTYTFNPRFVDLSKISGPVPLEDLTVTITRRADGHYVNVIDNDDGTYTVTINGEDHTFAASGDTNEDIRDGLIIAINAGSQPVTATNGSQQVGPFTLLVLADVIDELMVISIDSPSADMLLDNAPAGGTKAAEFDEDYRSIGVAGSPFLTDANGRINTDGIDLIRYISYQEAEFIHCQFEITIEGAGRRLTMIKYVPTSIFAADMAIEDGRMGVLRA